MTVREILEFDQLLAIVRRCVSSPLGMAELENLRPLPDRAQAEAELADLAEALEYLQEQDHDIHRPAIGFHGIHDVRAAAERLRIEGAALEPIEILQLLETLARGSDIK